MKTFTRRLMREPVLPYRRKCLMTGKMADHHNVGSIEEKLQDSGKHERNCKF